MHSLTDPGVVDSLVTRLGKLHPQRPRAWGRMTPHEMLCHLADCFELALGERSAIAVDTWWQRKVLRRIALHTSLAWPHGIKTRPEVEQGVGGTLPEDFEQDRARLVVLIRRLATGGARANRHPALGPLTREEWLIWGYRHTDHHLRQFAL
jgi:hypothetical protein